MSATGDSAANRDAPGAPLEYVLRLGDTALVLAQRLGEWIGHAPAIEEDLGLANTALDLLGQARLLLAYAGEIEGRGRGEDDLAFLREESAFRNATLAEMPNGDFGDTIVRQLLLDAYQVPLYERLSASRDPRLAEIAAKALKESRYHLRYSSGWVVRLGDGTEESHARVQASLERLWPYTLELFDADELDRAVVASGVGPDPRAVEQDWSIRVDAVLAEATLARPATARYRWYGKQGRHSEHLGHLLAEMQHLPRVHPGARW
ncbi:MAG: phenylacetate-CoA oxygenase subunit PaaC [Gammaproteobacteria bacterium]|nr:phenylacetate-CoA oxygenase subunit PaaC [Gammaproteobacteria bacterium]